MAEKLDTLIEKYVTANSQEVFKDEANEENKAIYLEAAKIRIRQEIYDEVRAEVKDSAIAEAEKDISERTEFRKIDELKKLMSQGFIVAFIVGLLINQVTDLVGIVKGSYGIEYATKTIWWTLGLLAVCITVYGWLFISEFLKLLNKWMNNETN